MTLTCAKVVDDGVVGDAEVVGHVGELLKLLVGLHHAVTFCLATSIK